MTKPDSELTQINERIQQEICRTTLDALTDENLIEEYKKCKSVENEIRKLQDVLNQHDISEETKQAIVQGYILQLIPAGTKGVIRGNTFNRIIQKHIQDLNLDPNRFEICFEKKCLEHITSEIPDWYILEKSTRRILIGMNQLDLWGGGHQLNRGFKYLDNSPHNHEQSRLLCVVCNPIEFHSKKNKAYQLFEMGFSRNTLCYKNNLTQIIGSYFYEGTYGSPIPPPF